MSVSRNPYERRRGLRDRDALLAGGDWSLGPARVDTPLTIHELEAMVCSAVQRGREAGSRDCDEAQQQGRREAWDQGYHTGREDGREGALADFYRLHGARLHVLSADLLSTLAALQTDARKVSKTDLAGKLEEAQALLMGVLNSHEQGFMVFK